MKRWKLISGVALVFILGAVAGSIIAGVYLKNKEAARSAGRRPAKAVIMEKFSKELNLREDQKAEIGKILDQIEEVRRDAHLKMRAQVEDLVGHIRLNLDPDQQQKFDVLREKYKARRKALKERTAG